MWHFARQITYRTKWRTRGETRAFKCPNEDWLLDKVNYWTCRLILASGNCDERSWTHRCALNTPTVQTEQQPPTRLTFLCLYRTWLLSAELGQSITLLWLLIQITCVVIRKQQSCVLLHCLFEVVFGLSLSSNLIFLERCHKNRSL